MSVKIYNESMLAGSEVFKGLNDIEGGEGTLNKAIALIKNGKHLTNEDIMAAYISVKQITDTLTQEALKAFDDGRTVLIYNSTPSVSVSKTLPFITLKNGNTFRTYVFMDSYITVNRDGVIVLQATVLRDLLTGALISTGLKNDYDKLATNQTLQGIMMEIYTKFVTRILNKQFSIAPDKVVFDTVQYWVNRFFLEVVFTSRESTENVNSLSMKPLKYIDELKYEEIRLMYDNSNPSKISELLELVKTASPRMRNLSMMTFLSAWIDYYFIPAYLAIDSVEYLIFMIVTLMSGNNIISISASDIVKEAKNIKSFRAELLKLI